MARQKLNTLFLLLLFSFSIIPGTYGTTADNYLDADEAMLGSNPGVLESEWDTHWFVFHANITDTYEFSINTSSQNSFRMRFYEYTSNRYYYEPLKEIYLQYNPDLTKITLSTRETYYIQVYSLFGQDEFSLEIKHMIPEDNHYSESTPYLFQLGENRINTSIFEQSYLIGKFESEVSKFYKFELFSDGNIDVYCSLESDSTYSETVYYSYTNNTKPGFLPGSSELISLYISYADNFKFFNIVVNITVVENRPNMGSYEHPIELSTSSSITGFLNTDPNYSLGQSLYLQLSKSLTGPFLFQISFSTQIGQFYIISEKPAVDSYYYWYGDNRISFVDYTTTDSGSLYIPSEDLASEEIAVRMYIDSPPAININYTISLKAMEPPTHATKDDAIELEDGFIGDIEYAGQPYWFKYQILNDEYYSFSVFGTTNNIIQEIEVFDSSGDRITYPSSLSANFYGTGDTVYIKVTGRTGEFMVGINENVIPDYQHEEIFSQRFSKNDYLVWKVNSYRNGLPITKEFNSFIYNNALVRIESKSDNLVRKEPNTVSSIFSITADGKSRDPSSWYGLNQLLFPVEIHDSEQSLYDEEILIQAFGGQNIEFSGNTYVINRTQIDRSYNYKYYSHDYLVYDSESNYLIESSSVGYSNGDNYTTTIKLVDSKLTGTVITKSAPTKQAGDPPISIREVYWYPGNILELLFAQMTIVLILHSRKKKQGII